MAAINIDRTAEVAREGYDYTTRAVKIAKKSIKVATAFGNTMAELSDIITAFKAFKIIKGLSAFRDLARHSIKLIKPGDLTKKFFATIGLLKAVKKIVGAVGVIFTYLNKFNLISASSLAWTTIAGYIFMPINFISAGISGYQLVEKVKFQKAFREDLSQAKKTGASTLVKHMIAHEPKLRKMRVLSKNSGLNYRLNGILTKLKSSNAEIRQKAKDESLFIKKRLKDRLREQVGVAGVSTSLSVGGVASTVVGLACPPAAPALAAVGLGLGVVGVANTIYSKFIPKGDIFETEKRMLFSHVVKGVEKLVDRFRPAAAAA
ncbi:MAG: hypothetical protein JSR37_10120 [Verrucomicrobia bacterium]|nr:hypothetical protein [Verrucomicrobiota bacterium]